ncbi:DUF3332 domain-containing protein [Duncaniella freteri]|uniref:DUF3332 domain-containing protein n=1 Tax=Duncaniella freteri TaxID=2530391 RepID=UPI00336C0B71
MGSFALTNKLLSWNRSIGSKIVNELVFIGFWILPVYEVSALADVLVINSIEFWSGSNPMASGKKVIDGQDGRYIVECDGKGYTITSENDGSEVRLDFDMAQQTWSVAMPSGESMEFMTFVDDSHVKMPTADGKGIVVELSDDGLLAYRAQTDNSLWAAR